MFRKSCYRSHDDDKKPMLSPTPKSVKRKKSYGCLKFLLWTIAVFTTLLVVLCLVSYHQGKLEDNVTKVPLGVRGTLQVIYEGARGNVKLLADKIHVGDKSLAMVLFGEDNITDSEVNTKANVPYSESADKIYDLSEEFDLLDDKAVKPYGTWANIDNEEDVLFEEIDDFVSNDAVEDVLRTIEK
eukprot:GFUD01001717.1.p1 GENE.GFUD01001717.1~~GFUD01001717.1.p1  ORF type:complete len:185 (-),score=48.50 GFUD01001717.1:131-685(-)